MEETLKGRILVLGFLICFELKSDTAFFDNPLLVEQVRHRRQVLLQILREFEEINQLHSRASRDLSNTFQQPKT